MTAIDNAAASDDADNDSAGNNSLMWLTLSIIGRTLIITFLQQSAVVVDHQSTNNRIHSLLQKNFYRAMLAVMHAQYRLGRLSVRENHKFPHLNGRWCTPIQESHDLAEKAHDAVVKFRTCRNLQRHRAVLPAIARLLFRPVTDLISLLILLLLFFLCMGRHFSKQVRMGTIDQELTDADT